MTLSAAVVDLEALEHNMTDNVNHPQVKQWLEFSYKIEELLLGGVYHAWRDDFSPAVINHIENYVLPQYEENDTLASIEPDAAIISCTTAIKKYIARKGKNQRPSNDGRDCVKRAHYAQLRSLYRGCILDCDIEDALHAFNDWRTIGE